jgi:hypothetical protein
MTYAATPPSSKAYRVDHGLQSDRTLKRSSREKGSRRTSDKEKDHERTRESDRRRRDREEDGDGRQALPEKVRSHLRQPLPLNFQLTKGPD